MASSEDFQTAGICRGGWWNPGRRSVFPPLSDFMWLSSNMEEYEHPAAATYLSSDESEDHRSSSSAEHLMVSSSGHAQFFQKPHRIADAGVSDWSQNISHDAFYYLDQHDAPTKVSQTGLENSGASMLPSLAKPGIDVDYIFYDNFVVSVSDYMHRQAGAASDCPKSISPSPKQEQNGGTKRCNSPAPFWDPGMGSDETSTTEPLQLLLVAASFENLKPYTGANSFNGRGSWATLKSAAADHTKDDITSRTLADDSTPLGTDKRKQSPTTSSDEVYKRPRIQTLSSLPTFKVRKEKLGDRITALQQLVSPFGKTDTASVLNEAVEYIKFLHDQVRVLTTPYLQNGTPTYQHQQQKQGESKTAAAEGPGRDLRSRGLCLVPISITFPVADEATADFWTPTFVGTMTVRQSII